MNWDQGSRRPLYLYKGNYPSTVTTLRGSTWHPNNLEGTQEQLAAWGQESMITGYIPQVTTKIRVSKKKNYVDLFDDYPHEIAEGSSLS